MRPAAHHRSYRALAGAAITCAAIAVGGCGSEDDPEGSTPGGGDVTFAEAKRGVADLVDDTYEAVLSGIDVRRRPEHAIPCREGGGAGGATGDYAANGALQFEVPKGEGEDLVRRVRDHWREKGYESIRVVPSGEAVFAQTDGYRLSFEVVPGVGRGVLGAGGPCAKPESKAELDAPPEFKALAG